MFFLSIQEKPDRDNHTIHQPDIFPFLFSYALYSGFIKSLLFRPSPSGLKNVRAAPQYIPMI